jgi:hypothetical protein
MQLGRRLNPFNANMAPVVVPLHIRQSAVASTELPGANLPELWRTRTTDRPIAQDVRVSRAQPHEATGAHQAEFAPLSENLTPGENLARPDAPRTPLPRAAAATVLPATQRMAMHAPNMPDPADAPVPTAIRASSSSSTLLSSDSANSVISHSMSPAMAPPIPPSIIALNSALNLATNFFVDLGIFFSINLVTDFARRLRHYPAIFANDQPITDCGRAHDENLRKRCDFANRRATDNDGRNGSKAAVGADEQYADSAYCRPHGRCRCRAQQRDGPVLSH